MKGSGPEHDVSPLEASQVMARLAFDVTDLILQLDLAQNALLLTYNLI